MHEAVAHGPTSITSIQHPRAGCGPGAIVTPLSPPPSRLPRVSMHSPVCILRHTRKATGAVGQRHDEDGPTG